MILNKSYSSYDNKEKSSKYSPVFESLIHYLERDKDMMAHHHRLLNVYVIFLEIFDYCIQ